MPYALNTLQCASHIESNWPSAYQPITEDTQKIVDAISKAFAESVSYSLKSLTIGGGVIVGGVAPPGGPVAGAVLTIAPGLVVSTPPDLASAYQCPDFMNDGGAGSFTDWHEKLIDNVGTQLSLAWTTWTLAWFLPAGIAQGGVAAWIPPAPPVPPAPGPWLGGTIVPFTFLGSGLSPSPSIDLLDTTIASVCSGVSASSDDTDDCQVYNADSGTVIDAISKGLKEALLECFQSVFVKDPSGSGAAGTAMPGGIIAGGAIAGLVLDIT